MNSYYYYTAFGLNIRSDLELKELSLQHSSNADVTIRREPLSRNSSLHEPNNFYFSPTLQILEWAKVGRFEIRGTSEIVFDINPDVPPAIVKFPLLGTVMAVLLQVRGNLALHGSAVCIGDKGVGFLGDKGAGKSTTASAMVAKGYKLIADDLLTFSNDDAQTMLPGFAQVKLTDESADVVKLPEAVPLPRIDFPGLDKRQHNMMSLFSDHPVAAGRLYILTRGQKAAITQFTTTESFHALIRFSHFRRFNSAALSTLAAPALMQTCARLAERGVVRRLTVPEPITRVFEVTDLILQDLEG